MGRKRRNQGLTVFNLPCDHADQAGSSAKRAQEAESEPAGTLPGAGCRQCHGPVRLLLEEGLGAGRLTLLRQQHRVRPAQQPRLPEHHSIAAAAESSEPARLANQLATTTGSGRRRRLHLAGGNNKTSREG
ncbi:unnamed protein product [Caretta caretta]